jgi:hypothetical protein
MTWWCRALLRTAAVRFLGRQLRCSWRERVANGLVLNTGQAIQAKDPVLSLAAPKQATDLRICGCNQAGSQPLLENAIRSASTAQHCRALPGPETIFHCNERRIAQGNLQVRWFVQSEA